MIKQVDIIAECNSTMGHIITVRNDQVFKVGQTIENKGKRYSIKGFLMINNARADIIDIVVDQIQ